MTNGNEEKLMEFCETHNLRITNKFYHHPQISLQIHMDPRSKKVRVINDCFIMKIETSIIINYECQS